MYIECIGVQGNSSGHEGKTAWSRQVIEAMMDMHRLYVKGIPAVLTGEVCSLTLERWT